MNYAMDFKAEKMVAEIAGFYSDQQAALKTIETAMTKSTWNPDRLRIFRDTERELFQRRLKNKVPRTVNLLKIALGD